MMFRSHLLRATSVLLVIAANAQTHPSIKQDAKTSSCSNIVALAGHVNVDCSSLTPAQQKIIDSIPALLQKILANQLPPDAVMGKLDQIQKDIKQVPGGPTIKVGTQGPCSVNQAGTGNTATATCAPPSRVLDDNRAAKFQSAFTGRGSIVVVPAGTDLDVMPLAKQICDLVSAAGWGVNCIDVPLYMTGAPIKVPSNVIGIHCYMIPSGMAEIFKESGFNCIYESGPFRSEDGNGLVITIGMPTIVIGNAQKQQG